MQLEIDSLGSSLRNFEELRGELIAAGQKFDAEALSHLPYEKLALCATGIAGPAMCSLAVVREEKRLRRERFRAMSESELRDVRTLLRVEQMDEDVVKMRVRDRAPAWESLRLRQQVWFKLNCIVNHIDGVEVRMREAIALLRLVQESHDLPDDFTVHQRTKVEILLQAYPGNIPDAMFRSRVAQIAFDIKKMLPDEEQRVCEAEVLQSYSCTSDCYRPLA